MNTLLVLIIALSMFVPRLFLPGVPAGQDRAKKDERDAQLRLKTDLVQVRAVVTDKRGQPVAGLKKEDFELLEDNRPQEISFFSAENVGVPSDPQRQAESKSLRVPLQDVGRTIVLFVDTVHTSFVNLARVKQTLRRFVDEQMTDRDMVALMTSSAAVGLMEQFTRDRRLLRAAIERLTAWRLSLQETLFTPYLAAQIARGDRRSLILGIELLRQEEIIAKDMRDEIIEPQVRAKARQILAEASYRRTVTLATLKGVVERTAEMPGQRMIAVFSEGFSMLGTVGGQEFIDLQPAISRAVRSGVVIYAIAAQGLQPSMMIPASHPGIPTGRQKDTINREMADLTSTLGASERDLETGLIILAKDTGGEAFFNTNDLNARLQKALNDNRVYYAFAYHAPDDDSTNRGKNFHTITVRVRNHPEYKVRTQRGYQPLEAKPAEQPLTPRQRLAQAIGAPLPVTTIPVAVSADYFERESLPGQAYIQTYIDANALQYREQDQHYLFDLETVITVYDLTGKRVHFSSNVANGNFTPERLDLAKQMGYRYTERVALKPGVYQARIGVLETATERIGTATGWIEVPDLDKGRLTLSALLLSRSPAAADQEPANKAGSVESLSPSVTQGILVYKKGAELEYRLVIYPGKDQKPSDLSMQIEVAQGDQSIYQGQWSGVESRVVDKDSKGLEVGGSLTLNGVNPGVYELRVSLKGPGAKKPVQRVASFGVEP
jgi:VWFA-related protein